ncbi:hypothetical protein WM24_23745 [Burkholderia ubonensis]|uniref:hypothetical protein n=1 Tax=Burkholderia ubonensis TaxID=101571 RepID=UPI00075D52B4|nr:hypothetical protein [Burkholderia ubonensis]KWN80853.1 hypothetical protein WM24_23745 [Burkholderia ubonensis]
MTWNHRVVEHQTNGETWRAIHEVYYDDAGVPWGYTENAVGIVWDEDGDPHWTLDQMRKALDAPVLAESDFIGKSPAAEDDEMEEA